MLQAGLANRKVALIHGAETLRAEAHLVLEREAAEHLEHLRLRLVVQRGIDAVTLEDGEADLAQRVAEVAREGGRAHVAGADDERIVECFLRRLGEVIRLPFFHAFVADVVLVRGHESVEDNANECLWSSKVERGWPGCATGHPFATAI